MNIPPVRTSLLLLLLLLTAALAQGCYRQWSRSTETVTTQTPEGSVTTTKTKRSSSGSWLPKAVEDEKDERRDRDFY